MRTINTTGGPVEVSQPPGRHINTSRVVEEEMTYTDEEPQVISAIPAGNWSAVIDGRTVPLVAFLLLEDGAMYGVCVEDGRVSVENNMEKLRGFSRYERQVNSNDKE